MGRLKGRYYTHEIDPIIPEGIEAPSVTTICSIISKPYLLPWACKMMGEKAAELITQMGDVSDGLLTPRAAIDAVMQSKDAWVTKRDKAGQAGTDLHDCFQWVLEGKVRATLNTIGFEYGGEVAPQMGEVVKDAGKTAAVRNMIKWVDETRYTQLLGEKVIYHPEYVYAGRFDSYGTMPAQRIRPKGSIGRHFTVMVDLKTGKSVGAEAMAQCVAYSKALTHTVKGLRLPDRHIVLHIPQTGAKMTAYDVTNVRAHWAAFKAFIDVFHWLEAFGDWPNKDEKGWG